MRIRDEICHKEIWKAGLDITSNELDMVFGDLKPEHVLRDMNPQFAEVLNKFIIIPGMPLPQRLTSIIWHGM